MLSLESPAHEVGWPLLEARNMDFGRVRPVVTRKSDGLCPVFTQTVRFLLTPAFLLGAWNLGRCSAGVPVGPTPSKNPEP